MSGQSYIGSKISLISFSDIRYVGVLHNINSLESTVALQNVQSFGTEGRKPNPNEEILASDHTFDYVVFRGSDIKDLQVFEAPPSYKSEPPTPIHQQQIVNSQVNMKPSDPYYPSNSQYAYTAPPAQAYGNYWQNSNTAPSIAYSNSTAQHQLQQSTPPQNMRMPVPENYQQEVNYTITEPIVKNEQEEITVIVSPSEKVASNVIIQEKEEVNPINKIEVDDSENSIVDSLAKQVSDLDIKTSDLSKVLSPERIQKQSQRQQQQQQQQQQKSVTKGPKKKSVSMSTATNIVVVKNNDKNNDNKSNAAVSRLNNIRENTASNQIPSNSNNRCRRSTGGSRNNNILLPEFRSDFDFASSNAKFDKSEIIAGDCLEKEEVTIPKPDQFYNKEKSFFDDISCESKEFSKGSRGNKHQEERKLNLETFGQAKPSGNEQNSKRNRHRGRGRGRTYRGKDKNKILTSDESPRVVKEVA